MDDSTSRSTDVGSVSPFIGFRRHLDVYRRAVASGWSDAEYVALVNELDHLLVADGGVGFLTTPLVVLPTAVSGGPVYAKIETGNVAGSHKARHLFGLALQSRIDERSGDAAAASAPWAIASCGNAALGAAVVARAVGHRLLVFVPAGADPVVMRELDRLGAEIEVCDRIAGESGDPCLRELDRALQRGARPFTVQGPICPAVIDGGRTLGLELAEQLGELAVTPTDLYIQIGGGALATAVVDGLERSGRMAALPRLHPVQPLAAHPYVATWRRLRPAFAAVVDRDGRFDDLEDRDLADRLADPIHWAAIDALLDRSDSAMQPWPDEPSSLASGILDDITYDWKTVLRHQCRTGGWPVLVDEPGFERAQRELATLMHLVAPDSEPADATGAAGFAGLLTDELRRRDDGPVVVIASGRIRS